MNTPELIGLIEEHLGAFGERYEGLSLRQKVLRLVDVLQATRKLYIQVVRESGCDGSGARERIRLYFIQYVGVTLSAPELEVVSGISDYGRRIRELRVQDGYRILSGSSNDPDGGLELRPNQYVLIRPEPDHTASRRWHIANRIRRIKGIGAKEKILQYFQENVGQIITSEELSYVANSAKEFGRRTRELRTEEGYAIATIFTGRPDLKNGEYVLESRDRIAEPHDRHIPKETQEAVFERDKSTCQSCGWTHEQWTRENPRFLELHHIMQHLHRGDNIEENLLVLCNVCHDGVHAGRIALPHRAE